MHNILIIGRSVRTPPHSLKCHKLFLLIRHICPAPLTGYLHIQGTSKPSYRMYSSQASSPPRGSRRAAPIACGVPLINKELLGFPLIRSGCGWTGVSLSLQTDHRIQPLRKAVPPGRSSLSVMDHRAVRVPSSPSAERSFVLQYQIFHLQNRIDPDT